MEYVEPIRDKNLIDKIKQILRRKKFRDFALFVMGINTGLRISDILPLKVSDVRFRTHITIKEKKTGKPKRIKINPTLKTCLDEYMVAMDDDDYLFRSQKGQNQPLRRTQAYLIINNAARQAGIKDKIGTHTLRKTFGYHHYQQYKDVAILQDIFNHSAPSVTLRYIGINDDLKDKSIDDFGL